MIQELNEQKVTSIDMVTSTFLTIAQLRKKKAGAILAVSDECLYGNLLFATRYFSPLKKNGRSSAESFRLSVNLLLTPV